MKDIVETLLDLANDLEAGEHVKHEDASEAMRDAAEEIEAVQVLLGSATSLLLAWRGWAASYYDCARRDPISVLDIKTAEFMETWRERHD